MARQQEPEAAATETNDEAAEQKRRGEAWGNYPPEAQLPPENVARLGTHPLRPKGVPRTNPSDFSVSLRAKYGTDQQLLRPGTKRAHRMRGFEETYVDIVDFIVRATHRIWEEKDVGYIYDHYKHNIRVVDDAGLAIGRDRVIAGTLGLISAFPDIRIIADEIIWAGDDEVGFHTSHRAFVTGTNTGYSPYGPPTGRRVHFWLIANCVFVANENVEEWVIYNTSSLIKQLGFDLVLKARDLGSPSPAPLYDSVGEPHRLLGQGKPHHLPTPPNLTHPETLVRHLFHYVWNWRLLGRMRDFYAPNVRFFGPTDRTLYGLGDLQAFVLSVLAAFPDLALQVDDLYYMGNDREGYAVATRWHLVGSHTGFGLYGPPTGRRVTMWGLTHHHIQGGKIVEEWTIFNEFSVLGQLYGQPTPGPDRGHDHS